MNAAYIKYAKIYTYVIDHQKKLMIRKYNWIFFIISTWYENFYNFRNNIELIELYYYDNIDLILCEIMNLIFYCN